MTFTTAVCRAIMGLQCKLLIAKLLENISYNPCKSYS